MAARYWRLTGIETYGGGDLELSELQLFALDANNNPVRVDQTATLTSSVPPIAGTLSALNDGDTSTTARFPTGPGLAFVWDFGDGGGYDMLYVAVGSGASRERFITRGTLQYSNDAITWSTFGGLGEYRFPGNNTLIQISQDVDPYYYTNVALLTPFDTAAQLADKGPKNRPPTIYGNAAITTASSRFGNGSLRMDGVNSAVMYQGGGDFEFGTGDFTIEFWVNCLEYKSSAYLITTKTTGYAIYSWEVDLYNYPTFTYIDYGNFYRLTGSILVPIGQWMHIAISRIAGVIRMFQNGVLSASSSWPYDMVRYDAPRGVFIGGDSPGISYPSYYFNGYLNDLRITKGIGRYATNFATPEFPAGTPASLSNPYISSPSISATYAQSALITGADVPPFTTATASPPIAIDIQDGGTGRITGTVREKTGISTRPLKRRVVLLDYRSNRKLREVVSDEATGVYSFDEIDLNREYTVIALDHTGQYRAVIADKLVPEKML